MPDNQNPLGGVWCPPYTYPYPDPLDIPEPAPEAAPEPQALRYNTGKPQLSYTPLALMEAVSHVMEFGATKYARDNWKKGFPYLSLVDSLQRHLMAWSEGEDIDPESGLSHMWHVACNVGFLCHQIKHGIGTDNRPKGPKG